MNTNKLLFQPWKGKNYDNSMFDIPVLIVGESNYGVSQGKEKDATFTHQLINSIIDGS